MPSAEAEARSVLEKQALGLFDITRAGWESSSAALFGSQPSFSSMALETCLVMELRTSRTKDSMLDPPLPLMEEQENDDDDEGLLINSERKLFLCSLHEHTMNTCTVIERTCQS